MEHLYKLNQNAIVSTLSESIQNEIVERVKNLGQEEFYTKDEIEECIQETLISPLGSVLYALSMNE